MSLGDPDDRDDRNDRNDRGDDPLREGDPNESGADKGGPDEVGPDEWGTDPFGEDGWAEEEVVRWPLSWRALLPRERWLWWERLWTDVCSLRDRYRLAVRSQWWEDDLQVEALAALAAWVDRYDSGEWDDPPGKLSLLFDLERIAVLLRDGSDPLHPDRDRPAFVRHLIGLGCQPPPGRPDNE
jgi:hypothetical protein